jgi:hypothetical protein
MATAPESSDAGRNRAPVQIAVALAVLVVLLGALWFLVLRGGGEEPTAPAPAPAAAPQAPATPAPKPANKPGGGPVETFEVFAPRDPFEPLVLTGGGGGAGAGGTTTVGTTTGGAASGGSGGGGGGGGAGTAVGSHRVQVVDVYRAGGGTRAQVEVDGTVFTVRRGETFADNFQLVSASGQCATMLYGDDQFTLCEGEEILK